MNMNDYFKQQNPPKSYLAESILVTVFCCLPFGIVGIVNAANVESRFKNGDYDGAIKASEEAKRWTMISFWAGLVFEVFIAGLPYYKFIRL